jgi:hypothetical protein
VPEERSGDHEHTHAAKVGADRFPHVT